MARRYKVLSTEVINDKFGGGWILFKCHDSLIGQFYAALSGSYLDSTFPFVTGIKSWNGAHDAIDEFAAKHQEHRVAETWFNDQNHVGWTMVFDKGVIRDDFVAGTRAYNGALISSTNDGDLRGEIFLFAEENKALVKPADPVPPVPPPPTPPVPDPTKPKDPVVPPPPPPASNGPGIGTILLAGGAIAVLLYTLRD